MAGRGALLLCRVARCRTMRGDSCPRNRLVRGGQYAVVYQRTGVELPDAIAAYASPRTGELLVVSRRGDIIRVPLPG